MKKLYVLQHIDCEPLGVWEEELRRWHVQYQIIKLWEKEALPDPAITLAAIVLGGPMHVQQTDRYPFLKAELAYLRELVVQKCPLLAVCLGAQLLATSLGAKVETGAKPEIGFTTVTLTPPGAESTLLRGFPMELPVFQWHSQGFDLPKGAELLATSPGYPHQAFRYGEAWGFQFHLEVTPEMVSGWAKQYAADLETEAGITAAMLMAQVASQARMVSLYGRQVIRRFWDSVSERVFK